MNRGFKKAHFELLCKWGSHHYDGSDPGQAQVHTRLESAWIATEAWAATLQTRMFPLGRMEIRKAPINQGQVFTSYTWAKIYPVPSLAEGAHLHSRHCQGGVHR